MPPRLLNQATVARTIGGILLALGLIGLAGKALGLQALELTLLHDAFHVVPGLLGLLMPTWGRARAYNVGFGGFYLVAGAAGFLLPGIMDPLLGAGLVEHGLHGLAGGGLLAAGALLAR